MNAEESAVVADAILAPEKEVDVRAAGTLLRSGDRFYLVVPGGSWVRIVSDKDIRRVRRGSGTGVSGKSARRQMKKERRG